MAISTMKPTLELKITLVLDEAEAFALSELGSYNGDDMLKGIESVMGPRVLETIKPGLRSLLTSARMHIAPQLDLANQARKVLSNKK